MSTENISPGGVMENRWSDRRELRLDVEVFREGTKICSCQSKDIGLGGAFLDFESAQSLPQDAFGVDSNIDIVFHLISEQAPIKHNLHARIVRITENGIGLKFHEFDTGVFRSLQEIMSYKALEEVH
jgi:hypothetical protein